MEDKNKIGDFFREHLSDYKEEVNLIDLEMMSNRMAKSNFMRFSLQNFNVYYAAAICSGFLVSLFLGGHYITIHNQQTCQLKQLRTEIEDLRSTTHAQNNTMKELALQLKSKDRNLVSGVASPSAQPSKSNLSNKNLLSAQVPSILNYYGTDPEGNHLWVGANNVETTIETEQTNYVTIPEPTLEPEMSNLTPIDIKTKGAESLPKLYGSNFKNYVVVHKKDTLYQYDTLKVKKKRK